MEKNVVSEEYLLTQIHVLIHKYQGFFREKEESSKTNNFTKIYSRKEKNKV